MLFSVSVVSLNVLIFLRVVLCSMVFGDVVLCFRYRFGKMGGGERVVGVK